MSYLGKTPSQATRSRFYYTATGGETSLSGADDNGNTLVFSDGNFVDVMLNGVNLVADTDYNTTTANTIGGLTALTASDIVEIVVYDTFSVFSGNVNSNFSVGGDMSVTGTTNTGLVLPTTDDSSDLGSSTKRYQDIYTSGGVYLGGTGSANYFDDYEEGTFTPTVSTSNANMSGISYVSQQGVYTKIGNLVYFRIQVGFSATTIGTGGFQIRNLPFSTPSGGEYRQNNYVSTYNLNWDTNWMQMGSEGVQGADRLGFIISRDNTDWENLEATKMSNSTTYYYQVSGSYISA